MPTTSPQTHGIRKSVKLQKEILKMATPEEAKKLVIKSLENENFDWRTIDGISNETGLDPLVIHQIISQDNEDIVQLSAVTKDGKNLFTTREKFSKTASPTQKIMGALKNRLE
jgi:uncharacterized protein (UPF0264 family)